MNVKNFAKFFLGLFLSVSITHGMDSYEKKLPKALHKMKKQDTVLTEDTLYAMMCEKGYHVEDLENMKRLLNLGPSLDSQMISNAWNRYKNRLHNQDELEEALIKKKNAYMQAWRNMSIENAYMHIIHDFNLDAEQLKMLLNPKSDELNDPLFIDLVKEAIILTKKAQKTRAEYEAGRGYKEEAERKSQKDADSDRWYKFERDKGAEKQKHDKSSPKIFKADPISKAYATLGIDESSSWEEIRAAYKRLSLKNHPDKGGDVEKMKEITDAFDVLKRALGK